MAAKIFTKEIEQFIRDNIVGKHIDDLTDLINKTFDTNYTIKQITTYKNRHRLKNGVKPKKTGCKKFSKEVIDYINTNVAKMPVKELVGKINETFGTNYTYQQVKSYKLRYKVKSGINTRYTKGHVPHNKGKKGVYGKGSEKSWFKKGHIAHNRKPVGTERIGADGYIEVKVKEPKTWVTKHRLVWEEHNGPVPKGKIIMFLDGDKQNVDINNLTLVTRAELQILNQKGLIYTNAEITKTGVAMAKVLAVKYKKQKELKERSGDNE